jgi:TATA-box binding protein (TBP) (component of TFIID and TFIIIB)
MSSSISQVKKDLIFSKFDDIPISTRTFTAMTNLTIDLDKLFNFLPITDYIILPKKRGRKKKEPINDPNKNIKYGSIVTLKFKNNLRGVDFKKKSTSKKPKKKWFRNSFTVIIVLDKRINFKICNNGTFQMTGCKSSKHAQECVQYIWNYIKNEKDNIYTFSRGDTLESLFIPAMRNIDFDLGFKIDRIKLARYMMEKTDFHSFLEPEYTGVNIKKLVPSGKILSVYITKMVFKDEKWVVSKVLYQEYLDLLSDKDKKDKINKERYNTFLVFHSGKAIFSGCTSELMEETYNDFINIIKDAYEYIEERLD